MEHQELWFTALLNYLLAAPVVGLLELFGYHPVDPSHPISNHLAMQIVVALIIMGLFGWLRSRLSVDRPGKVQQMLEMATDVLSSQSEEIVGHDGPRFLPLVFTLGMFIFLCNMLGIIPGFETPTDQVVVTAGCALVAFVYYNYQGLRHHGFFRYMRTFMGPVWPLAPLMFVIEIVSHLARLLSLSVRLFANMTAGHNITLIFVGMVPLGAPILFEGLHIFVGTLQAYIFVLLTMVYLAGAVSEEH
ncbi:MAG: F0F1 ATP synthase subunit A [Acidobacteria bacterium]|nr:F0F1 ATP synthase subunit A [Acidobacteriota bacterium]